MCDNLQKCIGTIRQEVLYQKPWLLSISLAVVLFIFFLARGFYMMPLAGVFVYFLYTVRLVLSAQTSDVVREGLASHIRADDTLAFLAAFI